jgi:hypothetical protein
VLYSPRVMDTQVDTSLRRAVGRVLSKRRFGSVMTLAQAQARNVRVTALPPPRQG